MINLATRLCFVLFCNVFVLSNAYAVAYCALRDPINTIYQLFPEADNYRSHVQTVGKDTRAALKEALPFDLHFNELGRHTLYVAQHGDVGIGFVHARSEQGKWGLNEYVWAISPSLRIVNVKIQRSRDPDLRDIFTAHTLVQPLIGKDLTQLIDDYHRLSTTANNQEMLRSAIKTLFVTENVWSSELNATSALSVAKKANSRTDRVIPIDDLFNSEASQHLAKLGMKESATFEREKIVGFRMIDEEGEPLGFVFRTPLAIRDPDHPVWWVAEVGGEIRYVQSSAGDRRQFSHLVGFSANHPRDCSSALELAALEVSLLARSQ